MLYQMPRTPFPIIVLIVVLLLFCTCRALTEPFTAAPSTSSDTTAEPQYSDDIILGLQGTEAPYTPVAGYITLKGRGFIDDQELILSLNVPDTRVTYTFAPDLATAAQLCTDRKGIGFSPLDFASFLGGAVVLLAADDQDTPPRGWNPLSTVPFHDNTVFYLRS